ncbi:bifunctional NAD(P)H-hydrate repair enzyme [Primorskyibacter flagellatus]|uniref:Multifunctional fusion protein n=1 Tax=Primorskyibacter flagellatus TaxID=1387277 RepID=A0A917A2J1_9RHOB|nr:NAD(P)H-hydrate dehydratase [Primorskyibacter flagellatus]GGE23220.1 bifunctional NAD(P)H-hydrate repair enzyme [Primorskyibacter flagellatus]
MTELLTCAQMRDIERRAIESGSVTGLDLMERAGQGIVDAIFAQWPELLRQRGPVPAPPRYFRQDEGGYFSRRRAVVLCGPGNNGGDGYVVARLLHRMGWQLTVFGMGEVEDMPPDARVNRTRWSALGPVVPLTCDAFLAVSSGRGLADVYVDALFGTGMTRPVQGEALKVLDVLAGSGGDDFASRTVAVDAPSGLCLDSGHVPGRPEGYGRGLRSVALTVTFDSPKVGHVIGIGPDICGRLAVCDIGLRPWREFEGDQIDPDAPGGTMRHMNVRLSGAPMVREGRRDPEDIARHLLKRASGGHKFDHGHCLVVSGGVARTGAARLAARAALRIGAGLVTLAVPPDAVAEVAAQTTAVMVREVTGPADLAKVLEDRRIRSICLGPGLGVGARTREMVAVALEAGRHVVLDADALTSFADDPGALFALIEKGRVVLTPHGGEFARLFPEIDARLNAPRLLADDEAWHTALAAQGGPLYSKVDAAREAAASSGAVVLLKGRDTVIALPEGPAAVHAAIGARAAPWLATAGAGDVLAGFIAGLMARECPPGDAAECAAWLHVEAALAFGPGLIAEDLPEMVPQVLRGLENGDQPHLVGQ